MKKIKIIAGIAWAFICLILIIVLFPGLNSFSSSLAMLPFMKINPNYTGGEVAQSLVMDNCTIDIRRPVFDGLFGERQKGFVQIDWRGEIPAEIIDTIDFDFDNNKDFAISINSKSSETILLPFNNKIRDVGISTPTSYGWAVRVNLKK
ncbi:MAG: hypothetical protein NTW82_01375 [Bacteroidia bacterium]|nr:hypothetical protein [Bacteroidia bacterium]